jgi:amidophosphoribosyltransferase
LASEVSCIRPRIAHEAAVPLPAARTLEEIRLFLGADSVGYLSLESLRRAVGDSTGSFCTSCYTGIYPTEGVQLEVSPRRTAPEESTTVAQEASRREP